MNKRHDYISSYLNCDDKNKIIIIKKLLIIFDYVCNTSYLEIFKCMLECDYLSILEMSYKIYMSETAIKNAIRKINMIVYKLDILIKEDIFLI